MFVPFRVTTSKNQSRQVKHGWTIEENGCHIWQGGKDPHGYGIVYVEGRGYKVHRIRYEREVGPIPADLVMDHFACDTKACCNPAHVRPVTRRENNLRSNSMAARNASRTHCENGHKLGGDNALPHRIRTENNRMCRICYNERRKVWRDNRLARGCAK